MLRINATFHSESNAAQTPSIRKLLVPRRLLICPFWVKDTHSADLRPVSSCSSPCVDPLSDPLPLLQRAAVSDTLACNFAKARTVCTRYCEVNVQPWAARVGATPGPLTTAHPTQHSQMVSNIPFTARVNALCGAAEVALL